MKRLWQVLLALMMIIPSAVYASDDQGNGWQTSNGYVYYQNLKGLQTIEGKTYYFDGQGRQKTGWIKQGQDYYYFKIANGAAGYLMSEAKVNGITLDEEGKASGSSSKLELLALVNNFVFKTAKPTLTKYQRYKRCYEKVIKTFHYGGSHKFHGGDWTTYYGLRMIKKHKEVCWGYASVLAYMANACGYNNVQVQCTKKHGWAYVDGKYVDGSFGASHKSNHWFMFRPIKHNHGYPDYAYKYPTYKVVI